MPGSNETFGGFAAAADAVDLDEAIDLDGVMPTAGGEHEEKNISL